jgi:hypothetical protein
VTVPTPGGAMYKHIRFTGFGRTTCTSTSRAIGKNNNEITIYNRRSSDERSSCTVDTERATGWTDDRCTSAQLLYVIGK